MIQVDDTVLNLRNNRIGIVTDMSIDGDTPYYSVTHDGNVANGEVFEQHGYLTEDELISQE